MIPDARGFPAGGTINWTNGFLPARHQGVVFRSKGLAIDDLFPGRSHRPRRERALRELLLAMNARHLVARGADDMLAARVRSYELAAKMQLAVPEVTALDGETAATHALYGLDRAESADFGRGCLLARRLLERGVRFVQLFSGGSFGNPRINWDGHENMQANHGQEAPRIDRPVAGLLRDLRQRGMLDDTLVLFTTEFGRTPFTQSAANVVGLGRDHNQYGFSVWLAGAGLQARLRLWPDRRLRLEGRREPRPLARLPRHGAAPAGHRPRAADVLSQRHPAPTDERARRRGTRLAGVTLLYCNAW